MAYAWFEWHKYNEKQIIRVQLKFLEINYLELFLLNSKVYHH